MVDIKKKICKNLEERSCHTEAVKELDALRELVN